MKNIITICLSLILSLTFYDLSAQHDTIELKKFMPLDTFRLERYALPELKYRFLYIDFDLKSTSNTYSWNFSGQEPEKDEFSINPDVHITNSCLINNEKMQISGSDNFSISYNYEKRKKLISGEEFTDKAFDTRISSSRSFMFYNKNNVFLELSPYVAYDYYNHNDFSSNYLTGNAGIFIGKGRIEDVTDAWHTIRILKDLQRENLLARVPDGVEIKKIASVLSKTRHKRIFDYRIKRKQNLHDLDDVLTELGLVTDKNIDYYNSLMDMWYYGINAHRYANNKLAVGLVPSLYYYQWSRSGNSNSSLEYSINGEAKYTIFKPINMSTDFFINSVLDIGYSTYDFSHLKDNYIYLYPSISASITKYISSRTYASAGVKTYYQYTFGDDDSGSSNNLYGAQFTSNLNYYFSPRTNISLNLVLYYRSKGYTGILFDPTIIVQDINSYYNFSDGFGHGFTINLIHHLY